MRRARISVAVAVALGSLLTFAPSALAVTDNGGEGWWGQTTDGQITNVMFAVIIFIPVLITVLTIAQIRLDKRKHAREDAVHAREVNSDWRGGW
ncbi:MAG: hypothetical protein ABSH51_30940 [Solirubrobacteraceae bacterium]